MVYHLKWRVSNMAGVNHCTFIGNAGRDPELRATGSGKSVCNFSLGVTERKGADTTWVNVVCFDKLAEVVQQYVTKGKQVYVAGRLQIRKYTSKDGQERTATEVVASTVQFLGGVRDRDAGDDAADRVTAAFGPGVKTQPAADDDEESLPF